MESIKDFFIKFNHWFLLGFLLTLSLLWPLAAAPYFSHHDDIQTIRLYEMDRCIQDLQIPCRWVPDLGGLYGYPLFNYYAPLPYYFGEIFYLLTHNLIFSAKVMFGAAFVGSYIFMFLLGRKLWGNIGGMVSGVFYSFAPYHAVDFYVRGAMGELWGLMFFPAIFWSILRLKESSRLGNIVLVALFLAFLTLSHNLSTMLFIPVMFAFAGLLFFQAKDVKYLKSLSIAIVIGVALSAFYLLPVIVEKDLVHVETTVSGYFHYTEHFKGVKKLFLERNWGWGSSVREIPGGDKDGMSFQIGWVHVLGLVIALLSLKFLKGKNQKTVHLVLFSVLVIIGSVFMIHPRSQLIWETLGFLEYLQFPWRFLLLVTFFISLISGVFCVWLDKKKQVIMALGLVVLVVAFNFFYFKPEKFLQVSDTDLLQGKRWDTLIKRSIYDFLPIYASEPPAELATSRYEILTGNTQISNFKESTRTITFRADVESHSIIRLSQYYFPLWKILVNGQEAIVEYENNSLGLMTIILGPGSFNVEARLYDTPVRTISNFISLVAWLIFIILILMSIGKTRKWIRYYLEGLHH